MINEAPMPCYAVRVDGVIFAPDDPLRPRQLSDPDKQEMTILAAHHIWIMAKEQGRDYPAQVSERPLLGFFRRGIRRLRGKWAVITPTALLARKRPCVDIW
jgi:hypothetical protein